MASNNTRDPLKEVKESWGTLFRRLSPTNIKNPTRPRIKILDLIDLYE
uniref:Uncharacterized protein n=1 Tax=Rhizophora mucronata TaxID=61149 RepID=A0A2P2MNF2_RHIMU